MVNRKWSIVKLLFLLALIGGTAWILIDANTAPYRKMEGKIFGTFYHITYQSSTDYDNEILDRLNQVDASLSAFNPQSTVSKINRNEPVKDDQMFSDVFDLAMQVSEATDGAFDITVAPLVNLWGFGFKHSAEVTQARIDSIMPFVGYKKVTTGNRQSSMVNGQWSMVNKDDPRTMLDFSAIAKGYGCDQAAAVLYKHGIANYLIEIGGEICARGINPDHQPWTIGITKPDTAQAQQLQAPLNSQSAAGNGQLNMATSGNYRNFYVKDGKRYAHTIDPHTGRPVQHSLLSATVIAPTCAMADAYATAFMVMGLDKAKAILAANKRLKAYLIYTDSNNNMTEWHSPTLKIEH
ncbi:MAG: FAD:protein FMN transferase [Bacteroidaceae bacterium]|nr:FAD:protein FMN transferase [Bacteroidaceae bacterium]